MKIIEAEEIKKNKMRLKAVGFEESADALTMIMKKEALGSTVKFKEDIVMIFLVFDKINKSTEIICFDRKNERNDTILLPPSHFLKLVNEITNNLKIESFEEFEEFADFIDDWERENAELIDQFLENLKNFNLEKVLIEGLRSQEKKVKGTIMLSALDKKIIDTLAYGFATTRNMKFTKLLNFLFGIVKGVDFQNLLKTGESRYQAIGTNIEVLEYEFKKMRKLYKNKSLDEKIDEIMKNLK